MTDKVLFLADGACFEDNLAGYRNLPHRTYYGSKNTIKSCKKACFQKGYQYAGVQYSKECYCGNYLPKKIARKQSECNMACSGDRSQKCGGGNRMNVYQCTCITSLSIIYVDLTMKYLLADGACFEDNEGGYRNLPHRTYYGSKNTIKSCKKACFKKGYKYAGLQYSKECYCGNNVPRKVASKQSECNMDCSGDKSQKCGGGNRMNVYLSAGIIHTCSYF